MINLFAYRSTSPRLLKEVSDPIGKENDTYIQQYVSLSQEAIACWGNHGSYMERSKQVKQLVSDLSYLELNKTGEPKHPLYIKSDIAPIKYH